VTEGDFSKLVCKLDVMFDGSCEYIIIETILVVIKFSSGID
jgi:hypothetical protein